MTSKFQRKGNYYTFSCDQPGCHVNYQGEPGLFKAAWRDAREHGWVHVPQYEDGVSSACHYCPEHAKQFG